MNDETSQQPDQSPTLDEVYSEFNVQTPPVQSQPNVQPQANTQPEYKTVPDPISDTDSFNSYVGQSLAANQTEIANLRSEIQEERNSLAREKEESEIKGIASEISKEAGIKPNMAEVALAVKYREDAKFAHIWDNRNSNPAAFKKAMAIVSNEFKGEYAVKQDPQLVENQRAMNDATNTKATTQQTNENEKWDKMNDSEFDHAFSELANGG